MDQVKEERRGAKKKKPTWFYLCCVFPTCLTLSWIIVWTDSIVPSRARLGLSFSSESLWELIQWHKSLQYERKKCRFKSFLVHLSTKFCWFENLASVISSLISFWVFYDCLPGSKAIWARFLAVSEGTDSSHINPKLSVASWCRCVKVEGQGRFWICIYMSAHACGTGPIDTLKCWHGNHRARGGHLSSKVMEQSALNPYTFMPPLPPTKHSETPRLT